MLSDCLFKVPPCIDFETGLSIGDPDFPFRNLSRENPEIYRRFLPWDPPIIPTDDPTTFWTPGCISACTSSISQEEADLCAERQAIICAATPGGGGGTPGGGGETPGGGGDNPTDGGGGGGVPGGGGPNPGGGGGVPPPGGGDGGNPPGGGGTNIFYSAEASCSVSCPDGTQFSKIIPAEAFVDFTQARADKRAQDYVCAQAKGQRICLPENPFTVLCCWAEVNEALVVSGTNRPYTITLNNLPSGLVYESNETGTAVLITGAPSVTGDFPVVLTVEDALGNKVSKDYPVSVIGIKDEPGPIMDALINHPYSFQLSAGNMPTPLQWSAGGLPNGLAIDADGLISGTPTEDGAFLVAVAVRDAEGRECLNSYDLYVVDCATFQTQASFRATIPCTGGSLEFPVPLSYCDIPLRVIMANIGILCGSSCTPFDTTVTGQIEILKPDGSQFGIYTCATVAPFNPSINQIPVIPGQFLETNPAPYRVIFRITNISTPPAWTCGEVTIEVSAESEYP